MDNIKFFLRKYNLKPNDLLGQNFLVNEKILEQIALAADLKKDDEVLEIGAGLGNLTKLLARDAAFVLAVEKDQRFFPALRDSIGEHLAKNTFNAQRARVAKATANVELVFADILGFNFQRILHSGYKVVANIPYYITGKIIEMLLLAKNKPSKMVLLVQKEVADRIIAKQGNMSILAIAVQMYAEPQLAGIVPKEDFFPQPKVDSAILVLSILKKPRYDFEEKRFFRIVKSAFAGKRKQIHNTLRHNLGLSDSALNQIFAAKIIDPKSRPQDLSLAQWYGIYKILSEN